MAMSEPAKLRCPLAPSGGWVMPTWEEIDALEEWKPKLEPVELSASSLGELNGQGPLRIRGLIDDWRCRRWQIRDFCSCLSETSLRTRPCASLHEYGNPGPAHQVMSLSEYFSAGTSKGVIFENDYHSVHAALRGTYAIPAQLSGIHGAPIFSAGRRHTGVGFHHHHESWLAELVGRKVWFLLPPGSPRPPAIPPWWYTRQPPRGLQVAILEPGEVMYLPKGWWHATWNLDDSLALGWEGSHGSKAWTNEMHAIADGDLGRLIFSSHTWTPARSRGAACLAARSGDVNILAQILAAAAPGLHEDFELLSDMIKIAAHRGHVSVLEMLVKMAAACGMQSTALLGSALVEAATYGAQAVVSWLLAQKADIGDRHALALQKASFYGHPSVVECLLLARADVEHQDDLQGSTPLLHAAFNGHAPVVEALLRRRASMDACDRMGMAPLHLASLRGHVGVARMLLRSQADILKKDCQGRTALHLAAHGYQDRDPFGFRSGPDANMQVVWVLLGSRADLQSQDRAGARAVDFAQAQGHVGLQHLLRPGAQAFEPAD